MTSPVGHNGIAGEQLRSIVERVEHVEEQIKDLNGDKADIYREARGNGFDVPIIRKIVRMRKQDAAEREEADTLLDLYLDALGMLRVRS